MASSRRSIASSFASKRTQPAKPVIPLKNITRNVVREETVDEKLMKMTVQGTPLFTDKNQVDYIVNSLRTRWPNDHTILNIVYGMLHYITQYGIEAYIDYLYNYLSNPANASATPFDFISSTPDFNTERILYSKYVHSFLLFETEIGGTKCTACGGTMIMINRQTRAMDEPTDVFLLCNSCSKTARLQ